MVDIGLLAPALVAEALSLLSNASGVAENIKSSLADGKLRSRLQIYIEDSLSSVLENGKRQCISVTLNILSR